MYPSSPCFLFSTEDIVFTRFLQWYRAYIGTAIYRILTILEMLIEFDTDLLNYRFR